MRTLAFLLVCCTLLPAGGCTSTSSIEHFNMIPGADCAVQIKAPHPTLEIRNIGSEPADITIQADQTIAAPPIALPPNGSWKQDFHGNIDILLHNRGQSIAQLQLFTPEWNDICIALFPNGRHDRSTVIMIVEPQNPGWYEETAAEQAP